MKYLLMLDLALAAFGLALSLSMGYVALVYGLYSQAMPSIVAGAGRVLTVTACFLALTCAAGVAAYGVWRRRAWRWPMQLAFIALLPVLLFVVRAQLKP
ncbi:MAG: hypothetical protein QJR02_14935 [Sinobacteraceae bacterium]|nr:hypothetical protein [Nevskiaceae bacterium]